MAETDTQRISTPSGWWQGRRLRLSGLPRDAQILCVAALGASAVGIGVLVALAAGWTLPGGRDGFPLSPAVPRAIVVFMFVACGAASASLAAVAGFHGRTGGRLTLAAVALPAFAFSVLLTRLGWEELGGSPETHYATIATLNGVGAAAAVALVLLPGRALTHRWPAAATASLPYAAGLAAYLAAGTSDGGIYRPSPRGLVAGQFVPTVLLAGLGAAFLLAWQAIEGAYAAADAMARPARRSLARPRVFATLLAAKVAAVAVCYALVAEVADEGAPWRRSRGDGAVAWLVASLLALLAPTVVESARRRSLARPALRAVSWAFVFVFTATLSAAAVVALLSQSIRGLALPAALSDHLAGAALWLVDVAPEYQVAVVTAALVGGIGLLTLRRDAVTAGLLLAGVGAWSLPRVVGILADTHVGSFELLTFDTAFTVVVGLLLIGGRARLVSPPVALALVASTAVAYAGPLLGLVTSDRRIFYLSLVFPIVYAFLFDAGELNEDAPGRARLVLVRSALAAGGLALATGQIAYGQLAASTETTGTVIRLLVAMPLALLLVAAAKPERGAAG